MSKSIILFTNLGQGHSRFQDKMRKSKRQAEKENIFDFAISKMDGAL